LLLIDLGKINDVGNPIKPMNGARGTMATA
jgi:hypothetical protein